MCFNTSIVRLVDRAYYPLGMGEGAFKDVVGPQLYIRLAELAMVEEIMTQSHGAENAITQLVTDVRTREMDGPVARQIPRQQVRIVGEAARQVHRRVGEAARGELVGMDGEVVIIPRLLATQARHSWAPVEVPDVSRVRTWGDWYARPENAWSDASPTLYANNRARVTRSRDGARRSWRIVARTNS